MLTVQADYPRRPDPAIVAVPNGDAAAADEAGESEEAAAARMLAAAAEWADADPDDDTWAGFYLSLNLLEEAIDDEDTS